MNVRPIEASIAGEQVVGAHPRLTPTVQDAGWQRRLNLYTGRHLGESALQLEQNARAGRLAMAGRAWSHGVVSGLEVGIERAEERNEETGETPVRWYFQVAPGYGLTLRGEDVTLPQHLRVRVDTLQVISPPPGARPRTAPLPLPAGVDKLPTGVRLPKRPTQDELEAGVRAPGPVRGIAPTKPAIAADFAARTVPAKPPQKGQAETPPPPAEETAETAEKNETTGDAGAMPLELWRQGVYKPLLPEIADLAILSEARMAALGDPLRRPEVEMQLREKAFGEQKQAERPRVAVLVLRPVTAELTGRFNTADPCEQDPNDDAFADWQLADGVQVLLYAFPWLDRVPRDPEATFRNRLAYEVFSAEAALGPGEHLPWEAVGVPLGLVGFRADGTPEWVDGFAVVRDGGRPHRRTALLHGAGDPLLWQARLKQFAEQVAEVDWSQPEAVETFRSFAFMPPAGLLPRAAVDTEQWRVHAFPADYRVEAVPVPMEQLDAAIEASAALSPFAFDTPDRVRLLVPVPQELYEPRLLQEDVPDPQFEQEIREITVKRTEVLLRREDVRRKAEAVVEAATGIRPFFPPPQQDPERLDTDEILEPVPAFGVLAHEEPLQSGLHQHFFAGAGPFFVNVGDTLFAWVYLDGPPAERQPDTRPRTLMLQWNDGAGWEHRAYWGENLIGWGVDGTASRFAMGALPQGGRWLRLEVPAALVGLEGSAVRGIAFTLFDGRAAFHHAGKLPGTEVPWVAGAFPAGATTEGDPVAWSSSPRRFASVPTHRSMGGAGFHQHVFNNAPAQMLVQPGDRMYAYVYLDPAAPPTALLLQWNVNGSWEQRAYWGPANGSGVTWGVEGTNSRRRVGDLPSPGRWARLEVPAADVGLQNARVNGMAFGTLGGKATWDTAGTARGRGNGLRAEFFAGPAVAGTPLLERIDPTVDFDWGVGSPDPRVPVDNFSARWTGVVVPRVTEDFTFSCPADDGVRLWVDDTLVVDRWIVTAVPAEGQEARGTIRLTAGRAHRLRLEFFEAGGAAVVRLRWSSPSTPLQVIPPSRLFPPAGTPPADTEVEAREDAWLEEALPPGAGTAGSGAWTWAPHPVLLAPEAAFDTRDAQEGLRESLAVARLREQMAAAAVVSPAHQAELDRGLGPFVQMLDAKVKQSDDYVDFSFVRVQSDMYRLRQLMMGTTAATRLATSPAVAGIVRQTDSALDVRTKLVDYLKFARARGGAGVIAHAQAAAGGAITNTQALGISSGSLVANVYEPLGFEPMMKATAAPTHLASAVTQWQASAQATQWQAAPPPRTSAPPPGVASGGAAAPAPSASVPLSATWAKPALSTRIAPSYLGSRVGTALSSVLLKAPILGESYDFRTVTVAERAISPAANEAKSFSVLTRYEVLSGLARLDLPLDDLVLPGFAKLDA
ncbi:MAG TPA: PA14 domain-containing protein, partial [Longimicrobium sp.]|nr:PA14 domain-containing protein [Longimicrobium sp.]